MMWSTKINRLHETPNCDLPTSYYPNEIWKTVLQTPKRQAVNSKVHQSCMIRFSLGITRRHFQTWSVLYSDSEGHKIHVYELVKKIPIVISHLWFYASGSAPFPSGALAVVSMFVNGYTCIVLCRYFWWHGICSCGWRMAAYNYWTASSVVRGGPGQR